jgi:hypothetical protein
MDDASMAYVHEKEDLPYPSIKNFQKGFKLKKNYWVVSNLNLQTYGSENFQLDISVGNGEVEISQISNEVSKIQGIFIVKTRDGIKVTSTVRTFNKSYTLTSRCIEKKDLNLLIVKFCPQENKVIILIENKEFAVLENPDCLKFIMNPHEYNFYLKFL